MTGDGAFDNSRCPAAIVDRGGNAIIPIRMNRHFEEQNYPTARERNTILQATKCVRQAFWKGRSGYHVRNRIAAKMRCLSLSMNGSPREPRIDRRPKSTSASHS